MCLCWNKSWKPNYGTKWTIRRDSKQDYIFVESGRVLNISSFQYQINRTQYVNGIEINKKNV